MGLKSKWKITISLFVKYYDDFKENYQAELWRLLINLREIKELRISCTFLHMSALPSAFRPPLPLR